MSKTVILHINSFNTGSTGNIMLSLSNMASINGYDSYISYPYSRTNNKKKFSNSIIIGNIFSRNLHLKLSYYTGKNGCFSIRSTKKFLKKIDTIKPDIIHLHNLHNCYINLKMLFNYIKNKNIPVVWTLHDCWAFTGQCTHYTIANCYKWKKECYDCPQYRQYPASRKDKTNEMFKLKKSWFTGVENLTIVTPSKWLKSQVEKSFLSEYAIKVINNGIDLSLFKPTESNFRDKYNLQDKIILLGVANYWNTRKGLNIFIELSKMLNDKYKIVLVGLTNEQIKQLPKNILGLSRTDNQIELAEIYTASDYFLNPSLEETMGLVTVEALACGTPVIVSNSTAVPEVVNEKCGKIVLDNSTKGFYSAIVNNDRDFSSIECIKQAQKYDKQKMYKKYLNLYNEVNR